LVKKDVDGHYTYAVLTDGYDEWVLHGI
jgi:hypothetical protein